MSGGSLGYLCWHTDDLSSRWGDVDEVATLLERIAPGSTAAEATRAVLHHLAEARRIAEGLEKVWRDVEWWQSGDTGEEEATATAKAYRPPPEESA